MSIQTISILRTFKTSGSNLVANVYWCTNGSVEEEDSNQNPYVLSQGKDTVVLMTFKVMPQSVIARIVLQVTARVSHMLAVSPKVTQQQTSQSSFIRLNLHHRVSLQTVLLELISK